VTQGLRNVKKKKTVTISSGTHYYFIVYNLLMLSQKLVNHSNRIDPTVSALLNDGKHITTSR